MVQAELSIFNPHLYYCYEVSAFTEVWNLPLNYDLALTGLSFPPQYKKYRSSHAHTNNFAKSVVNLVDSVSISVFLNLFFQDGMVYISICLLFTLMLSWAQVKTLSLSSSAKKL